MSERKNAITLFRELLLDCFEGKYNDMTDEEKYERSKEIVEAYFGIDYSSDELPKEEHK